MSPRHAETGANRGPRAGIGTRSPCSGASSSQATTENDEGVRIKCWGYEHILVHLNMATLVHPAAPRSRPDRAPAWVQTECGRPPLVAT
jgi:hypothetical protein